MGTKLSVVIMDELANIIGIVGAVAFLTAVAVFVGCAFAWL